uniref:MADS-box domain-containing protein n=1 Tax=Aegilops tauschii subsp. strangulata TaxID=200361 RepID=A0A453SH26_AEGTS
MARRKVPMRLIEKARARAETHARRTKGLQKKASELATLCAVPVALVCAAGAGAPLLVWESEEGVLERYRRAVPAETRARHTHRSYMETELGKERAKLARTRHGCPGALADWDAALNDMTLEEARGLLETIDAALQATGDRMEALGIPADGGHGPLEGSSHEALMPQQLGQGGGNPVDMEAAGFQQLQMVPFHAGSNEGLLEQFSWDDPFRTQSGCVGGNYSGGGDAMLSQGHANAGYNYSAGGDEMLTLGLANADYNYSAGGDEMLALGLANADYNYSGGKDEMLAPGFANADYNNSSSGGEMLPPGFGNADYDWTDLTMWVAATSCAMQSCHLGATLTSPTVLFRPSTPLRSSPAGTTSIHHHLAGTGTQWPWAWATTSLISTATTWRTGIRHK